MREQDIIDAINADPSDTVTQLVYADWLDEQGDPRGEAWRVLLEEGKRPQSYVSRRVNWWWWWRHDEMAGSHVLDFTELGDGVTTNHWPTFHAAMNAAAIAWVRCHRDAEYLTETV